MDNENKKIDDNKLDEKIEENNNLNEKKEIKPFPIKGICMWICYIIGWMGILNPIVLLIILIAYLISDDKENFGNYTIHKIIYYLGIVNFIMLVIFGILFTTMIYILSQAY